MHLVVNNGKDKNTQKEKICIYKIPKKDKGQEQEDTLKHVLLKIQQSLSLIPMGKSQLEKNDFVIIEGEEIKEIKHLIFDHPTKLQKQSKSLNTNFLVGFNDKNVIVIDLL
jgi:hypothetical protein